MYNTIWNRHF